MPHKDPEQRKAWRRDYMRRKRAEGTAGIDPAKEAERKAQWYAEGGGKEKRLANDRRRRAGLKIDRINDITK